MSRRDAFGTKFKIWSVCITEQYTSNQYQTSLKKIQKKATHFFILNFSL